MSRQTLPLRLAGLAPGRTAHAGGLTFTILDPAGEESRHDVDVSFAADNLGSRIHIQGQLAGTAESPCHRCLNPFTRRVEASFELVLQKGLEIEAEEEFASDTVGIPEKLVEFDLAPYVREASILETPIQLLCRADCLGLCPQCGADRNVVACGCVASTDPHWEPLQKLRPPQA